MSSSNNSNGGGASASSSPLLINPHDSYQSPLNSRYASSEMKRNFSDQKKFSTFRRLWLALAQSQREVGVLIDGKEIKEQHLKEMEAKLDEVRRCTLPKPTTGMKLPVYTFSILVTS